MMDIDAQIADRVKQLRTRHGWTLEALAARSGVSRAMISKIERRQTSATAALLSRLGVALDVPVSDLLGPKERRGVLTRKAQRPSWRDPGTGFLREIVSSRSAGSAVEVVEVELPASVRVDYTLDSAPRYAQHIVALTGGLRVAHGGQEIGLEPGDALFMAPSGPISFHNTGDHPCRYLVVLEHPRTP
ncbi:MAG: XRE family transcriptional regulator [Ramlibacter sp.]|nr:XRE family transcriptional regulator [Ramlibacter sp.]